MKGVHPGVPYEMARLAERLKAERSAAIAVVRQLQTALDGYWDREIPDGWKTVGFVQELAAAAAAVLERDSKSAVALAQFAIVISRNLSAHSYPALVLTQVEAEAWKELANSRRYRSEYEAALRALDVGDRLLVTSPALGYDRAVLRFARAVVLSQRDAQDYDEALELLDECVADFSHYPDPKRIAQCLQLQGMIQQRRAQFREAIASYENALDRLEAVDDRYLQASLYTNCGQAYGELRETDRALTALRQAVVLFEEIRATGESVRTAWGIGRTLLAAERYEQARSILVTARRGLQRLQLLEEAGLAGLDLADTYIALGLVSQAQGLVEEVTAEFRAAHLNGRALVALGYLSDSLPMPQARPAVRHVRSYLDELRHSPDLLFLELPDETSRP